MAEKYFRKGFGLRREVADTLTADYHSKLVDRIRGNDFSLNVGELTFRLAREFDFCFGVERAVEYACSKDANAENMPEKPDPAEVLKTIDRVEGGL